MNENKQDQKRGGCGVAAVAILLLCLLIIYVLAVGPLIRIHDEGMMGETTTAIFEAVYCPLGWVAESSPVTGNLLEWYVSLWEGAPAVPPTGPMYYPPGASAGRSSLRADATTGWLVTPGRHDSADASVTSWVRRTPAPDSSRC